MSYSLPSDESVLLQATQNTIRSGTASRLQNKGFELFHQFLRTRSWIPIGEWKLKHPSLTYPHMDQFMLGGLTPLSEGERVDLLILYVAWLRHGGLDDKVAIQALLHCFTAFHVDVTLFSHPRLKAVRQGVHSAEMHSSFDARDSHERQMVPAEMLLELYEEYWPVRLSLSYQQAAKADVAAAVCVGFMQYHFGRRVGEFVKTHPESYWTKTVAQVITVDRQGAPLAACTVPTIFRDKKGDPLDMRLVVHPHAIRAKSVNFELPGLDGVLSWFNSFAVQRELERWAQMSPVRVRVDFYSDKVINAGKPVHEYLVPENPAVVALVRMLWKWSLFAGFTHELDLFFSRRSVVHGAGPMDRALIQSSDISELVKARAVLWGLPPESFSTNSFKIGGFSRVRKDAEDEGATPAEVQRHVSAVFRKTIGSSLHYQRPRVDIHHALETVWLDPVKDHSDVRDLLNAVQRRSCAVASTSVQSSSSSSVPSSGSISVLSVGVLGRTRSQRRTLLMASGIEGEVSPHKR